MTRYKHLLALGVIAAIIPLLGIPKAPALAEAQESHCVVEVTDQKPDGELVLDSPVCFDGPAAVFEYVRVSRLGINRPGSPSSDPVQTLGGTFILGTHFSGYNGSGSSISVVGGSCTGGWWNTSSAWDNRISSSYNGCYRLRHFNYPNKAGDWSDTTGVGDTDNLSSLMNNRTESVAYYSS